MKWTKEAEDAIKKVPFFVRKRVKTRVEKEALAENKPQVTLTEVEATRKRFLNNMESEVQGHRVETCFGSGGTCPNRAVGTDRLVKRIEDLLKKEDLLGFLKKTMIGDLKFHHEFRVTIADCPNACSQPQIRDIGIIGAAIPGIGIEECSLCNACVEVCAENAVRLDIENEAPVIDMDKCLYCKKCIEACPTGTLIKASEGFRVLLGGKLGRHPRLAQELPGIFTEDMVLEIVQNCVRFYKENSRDGKRFGELLKGIDPHHFLLPCEE